MAWTTPLTAVANAALTAAQWNASVRDNLNETAPAKATAAGQIFVSTGVNAITARTPSAAVVATSETTISTTYADLTTAGPSVTVTTGTQAIVFIGALMSNNTAGASSVANVAVSGATVISPSSDDDALRHQDSGTGGLIRATTALIPTLTAGSNTFKMQYRVSSGTGTFQFRRIIVLPL